MKQLLLLVLMIVPLLSTSQTEDEKRAIMAAKNKIQSDSVSLYSRSSRIAEQRRQLDILEENLKLAHRSIILFESMDSTRVGQLKTENTLRLDAEQKAKEATEKAESEQKKKKTWRKTAIILALTTLAEAAIIILL